MGATVLDLFSAAAGGWSLGMHRAGFRTVAACEAVEWRRILYSENNPGVPVYDDVCTLTADRLVRDLGYLPAIVVGSPPCQDISSANTKGRGVEGERSGLFFEAVRIIGEIRPRWFALENSANLRTRGADAVLAALEALGYTCWPLVVRASDIGANNERPRAWIIGCDLAQVADADGFGRDEGWSGQGLGLDVPVSADTGDAAQDGRGSRLQGRRDRPAARAEQPACGDAADTPEAGYAGRAAIRPGREARNQYARDHEPESSGAVGARKTPDPDQAGQADGCLVSGLRQAEIAVDGRSAGRGDDGPRIGQVGLCETDRLAALQHRADWSLDDLARHIWLDARLPAWVAQQRIAVGGPRGTTAASLIVEAFGDAVVPQIPEAIGRAIHRVEAALAAVYSQEAA